jgi:replicative DNA helicase
MTNREQFMRKVSILSGVSTSCIEGRDFTEAEHQRIESAINQLNNCKGEAFYDDTGGLTLAELSSRARKMKIQHDVKMIIVDYLQLMRISRKSATQQLGIAEIGRGIKALAKELEIPIMVLSQFHRGIENRSNKRPIMSDLRDSGTIEEDADLILFLYREGYYSELEHERLNGRTELNVAKQRGGAVGMLPLNLDMKSGSFTGLTH